MIEWLLAPIDPSRIHDVPFVVAWHGRLMVFAWGVLLPLGILTARFLKITPKQNWPHELDSKFWWRCHLSLQISGIVIMLAGLALILSKTQSLGGEFLHWYSGWAIIMLGIMQFLSGWLRGSKGGPTEPAPDGSLSGDHYDMTPQRRAFEYYHKFGGYFVLLLSAIATVTGMWNANGPRWMWLGLFGWWCVLAGLFIYGQRKSMAIDTYHAIWGPDKNLPGNKVPPIGFGISRRDASKYEHHH